jgi:hypothetical protein
MTCNLSITSTSCNTDAMFMTEETCSMCTHWYNKNNSSIKDQDMKKTTRDITNISKSSVAGSPRVASREGLCAPHQLKAKPKEIKFTQIKKLAWQAHFPQILGHKLSLTHPREPSDLNSQTLSNTCLSVESYTIFCT